MAGSATRSYAVCLWPGTVSAVCGRLSRRVLQNAAVLFQKRGSEVSTVFLAQLTKNFLQHVVLITRLGAQAFECFIGADFTVMDDADAIGKALGDIEELRGVEDGAAALGGGASVAFECVDSVWIHAGS